MAVSTNINDILSQVKQLDEEDQLTVLQQIALLLKRAEAAKDATMRLSTLSGLGSEIWKSTDDIDSYIDAERQW